MNASSRRNQTHVRFLRQTLVVRGKTAEAYMHEHGPPWPGLLSTYIIVFYFADSITNYHLSSIRSLLLFRFALLHYDRRQIQNPKNTLDFKSLTALCKTISKAVVEDGGVVKSIQNHGIREFPHRFKAKYPDYLTQERYYSKGRYFFNLV